MTVVVHEAHIDVDFDQPCTLCGSKLQVPFIQWKPLEPDKVDDILLCSECVTRMCDGFVADVLQCSCITKMKTLGVAYKKTTLDRRNEVQLASEERAEFARGAYVTKGGASPRLLIHGAPYPVQVIGVGSKKPGDN